MRLSTVAECVESEEIRRITRELGVDFGQGFAIARPTPMNGVLESLLSATI
jgi:EAL domain-containing protein (putative c-di-GMP-specific phosphodiesterase class I)